MRLAPETILVVEDDLGQAELIQTNLELGNVPGEIVHVTDGEQALEFILRQGRFRDRRPGSALVLLDLNLPRLDGLEFLRELQARQKNRQTPVLVFAASDNPLLISQCYELGASLYLRKPFLIEDFLVTIERVAALILSVSVPVVA
ncbi:MAG: response regulator [Acidobacteria bacterium]|nr:response regulator [Acidobacteriota bacterium]